MKIKFPFIPLGVLAAISLCTSAHADPAAKKENGSEGQHHREKKVAGPHGGRVLTKIQPHAEFFVSAARTVQITFLGDDGKAIAPSGQSVTMVAGERRAPTKFTFSQEGSALVSSAPLPAGNSFPAILHFKMTPDAKPVAEKFTVDLSLCSGCSLAEYACICGH
jgi:hypothetical protein